jgi:hypothetical protein
MQVRRPHSHTKIKPIQALQIVAARDSARLLDVAVSMAPCLVQVFNSTSAATHYFAFIVDVIPCHIFPTSTFIRSAALCSCTPTVSRTQV